MRVLPVIDLMGGQVVRGVGGRRGEYRAVVSGLVRSAEPLEVARAFREHFGFDELYLADLDAIGGQKPAVEIYRGLRACGFRLWVDGGVDAIEAIAEAGVETLVAGLESLRGPEELVEVLTRFGTERVVFSLDLKGGRPLGSWGDDAWEIASEAIGLGMQRMIVLDLADVGEGQGTRSLQLCARLRRVRSGMEIVTGGGVRGSEDLRALQACGVDGVLVASALHDGRVTRAMVAEIR